MKRILTFVLFASFLYSTWGYYAAFHVLQYWAKQEAAKTLENQYGQESLVVITYHQGDSTQILWLNSHEIRYNGELYDVINQSKANDVMQLYCLKDNKEEGLLTDLAKHITNTPTKKSENKAQQSFIKDCVLPVCHWECFRALNAPKTPTVAIFLQRVSPEISSPPPKA